MLVRACFVAAEGWWEPLGRNRGPFRTSRAQDRQEEASRDSFEEALAEGVNYF